MNGKKRFVSLKTKIMVATLVPFIFVYVLSNAVGFYSLFNVTRATAEAELLLKGMRYANSFELKIVNAMNYISLLASELEMRVETGFADRETLQKTIQNIFNNYEHIDGSSIYFEPDQYDGRDAEYR